MSDNIEIKGDSVTIDSLRGLSVIGTLYLNDTNVNTFLDRTAPSSSTSTGTLGQIACDNDYLYVCTAANTWKRTAALSGWGE
jgi:hypothetical protein